MDIFAPLNQLLTIRAKPINATGATRLGVIVPPRRYLWYYAATWPDGSLAASLHLGEGIAPAGETRPWGIMRRDRTRTLLQPGPSGSETAASFYPAGSGVNGAFSRLTEGNSRLGGFDILGRGWRGGVGVTRETKQRCLLIRGDGDPPDVYYLEPLPHAPAQPSLAAALLLAYVLIEHEVREGNWIKRPDPGA